jgi:hypothetical protein
MTAAPSSPVHFSRGTHTAVDKAPLDLDYCDVAVHVNGVLRSHCSVKVLVLDFFM